jgi:hypothetical protein
MSAQDNLNPQQFKDMVSFRSRARRGSGVSTGQCGAVSMHNEEVHGLPATFGTYDAIDGAPMHHVWNTTSDGHILDATADQRLIGDKINKGVRVLDQDHPDYGKYHPSNDQQAERARYSFAKIMRSA